MEPHGAPNQLGDGFGGGSVNPGANAPHPENTWAGAGGAGLTAALGVKNLLPENPPSSWGPPGGVAGGIPVPAALIAQLEGKTFASPYEKPYT
jgi:hypothetical protein